MTRRVIDLDQRRTEAGSEPVDVIVGGRLFTFAPRLPIEVAIRAQSVVEGETPWAEQQAVFMELCGAMVGPDNAEALLSAVDMNELLYLMQEVFGADLGELLASAGSSPSGGNGSRQT